MALGALLVFPLIAGADPMVSGFGSAELWKGDWAGMVKRKQVRMLIGADRTGFFYDGTKPRGFFYEISQELEKFLNQKLKLGRKALQVRVVLIPAERDKLLPFLEQGTGDIAAAGLTVTPERLARVDFSDPMLTGVSEVAVAGIREPRLTRLEDLAGREVWVRRSSSYYQSMLRLNEAFAEKGLPSVTVNLADEVLEDEDLMEMVQAGIISMTLVDDYKASFWAKVLDGIVIYPDVAVRRGGKIAWALRKKSPGLKKVINEFIKTHKAGTLYGNLMLQRYFKDTGCIKNPVTEEELAKFRAVMTLIKKYAAQYDFDWLMIASQAYQESRLDPKMKSKKGAVGVMQVLPSTAKDPRVGIPEIEDTENNIHAGVKYLKVLRDEYFNEPSISALDKTLLVFAAYNAGPKRIRDVRKRAAQMKLDPDRWFHNVETAAAETIGSETVRYVSNIYKYYIAYKMMFDIRSANEKAKTENGLGPSKP